jgi:hypothetical protein
VIPGPVLTYGVPAFSNLGRGCTLDPPGQTAMARVVGRSFDRPASCSASRSAALRATPGWGLRNPAGQP